MTDKINVSRCIKLDPRGVAERGYAVALEKPMRAVPIAGLLRVPWAKWSLLLPDAQVN